MLDAYSIFISIIYVRVMSSVRVCRGLAVGGHYVNVVVNVVHRWHVGSFIKAVFCDKN